MLSQEKPRKDALRQDWKGKHYMAFFRVTADESGKLRDPKCEYASFCGYFGMAVEWERFEYEWLTVQSKWNVPPIHMAKIFHPNNDDKWSKVKDRWGKHWEYARDAMLKDFSSVVLNSRIAAVGAVVDAAHFRKMPDSNYKKEARDPLFLSLQLLISESIDRAETIMSSPAPISLVIDDDQQYAMLCYEWINILRLTLPKVKERISGICFVKDDFYQGVQAADMIAYEARKQMVKHKTDPNGEPSDLLRNLTHNFINNIKYVDASVLDELNGSMEAKSAESGV